MKVGDLVRVKDGVPHKGNYKLGIIMSIYGEGASHCWVRWKSWPENDKWMCVRDLEVLSEGGRLGKDP